MLLVVPEVPGTESRKPLIQGFGCRLLGGDTLSCEALFAARPIPTQALRAQLHTRGRRPTTVTLDWSEVPAGLYRNAQIDLIKET
jgi:hypothetical protein